MSRAHDLVAEFHEFFNQPNRSELTVLSGSELELRKTLIREEYEELMEALDIGDAEHIYKEMADLLYVLYGLDCFMGGKLDAAFEEVAESNMSKLWLDPETGDVGPRYREDGKVLKPPTYFKPDLSLALSDNYEDVI